MLIRHIPFLFVLFGILFCQTISAIAQTFTNSNLPIVIIDTDGGIVINKNPKVSADMKIIFRGPNLRNYVSDASNPAYLNYNGRISINVRGSSSANFPKKQYRLETQDASGNDLNVPLLGLPIENDWILGAPYTDKSLMRNVLAFDMARQQGQYAPRTVFCELVLNGEFMGLYYLTEKIKRDDNRVNIKKMLPTDVQEPEISGGYILKIDRFSQNINDGFYTVIDNTRFVFEEPGYLNLAPQQLTYIQNYLNNFENAIFSADYGASHIHYRDYMDVNSSIDMILLKELAKDVDAYFLSNYISKDREGKLVFQPVWDFNLSYGNANYRQGWTGSNWMLDLLGGAAPSIFNQMWADPDYYQRMQCRWAELRANQWRTDSILNRIDEYRTYLDEAATRNFNKWQILGKYIWPNPGGYSTRTTYQSEIDFMKNWVINRTAWIDSQLGTGVCIKPPPPPLVINEIHYNPLDYGTQPGSNMEFIELKNIGTTTINLSEATFTDGIIYSFPVGFTVAPGDFVVIASNANAFQNKYGFSPDGDYGGQLKNQGERLEIRDVWRQVIDSLTFNDAAPWPTEPDSLGPSLELIDELSDNTLPESWHASLQSCGTPGMENSITTFDPCSLNPPQLIINEINYNSSGSLESQDWIELYNPSTGQADLSGWQLHDEDFNYDFPNGTIINGTSFLVVVQNATDFSMVHPNVSNYIGNFDFNLNANGERIQLLSPEGCLVDEVDYNDAAPWPLEADGLGATLSLLSYSADNSLPGNWESSQNAQGTPGAPNTNPCTGGFPSLVINEINYRSAASPNPGDWVEIHNSSQASVNLSGWEFHNSLNRYEIPGGVSIPPGGYIVLTQNKTLFTTEFPHISNPVGNLGFSLNNISDRLVLYNPQRCLVDEVSYSYLPPWPPGANGQGNTLSLSNPTLDNNIGNNWEDSPGNGTPGRENSICPAQDIVVPDKICIYESTNFVVNTNLIGADYQWTFNGATPSSENGFSTSTTWLTAGDYQISLTINWYECQQIINKTITVIDCNTAPIAVNDSFSMLEDVPFSGNVSTNDSDPDGDNISVVTVPVQSPSSGTLTLNSNGTFTYTPFSNFNGNDQFVYRLCDNGNPQKCSNATVSLNVNAANDVPVVADDNASTIEDVAVTINILNNDFDIDGNLDLASIVITNAPPANQGVISINGNGSIVLAPASNYNGNLNFNYTICDDGTPLPAKCDSGLVTVVVESVNDEPQATSDSNTTDEDTSVSGNVSTNDSDLDGDNLFVQTNPVVNPANGSVVLATNGDYTYTPDINFNGIDNFTYEICDGQTPQLCDQATVTITIDPINDTPFLNNDVATTSEDESITIFVLNNDSNIDGNFDLTTLTISNEPPANQGAVGVNSDGSITFIPLNNYNGTVNTFSYTICDDGAPLPALCATGTVSITISPVNDPPIAENDVANTIEDGSATGNVLSNDTDIEDNLLTASTSPITNPTNGVVTLLANGNYNYTPNQNYNGNDAFTYEVCDDGIPQFCTQAVVNINVTAVNDAPIIIKDVANTNEDTPITIFVINNDNDVDGNLNLSSLILTSTPPPNQGTVIVNADGSITFSPANNFNGTVNSFDYQICDTGTPLPAECATAMIDISVSSTNDNPIAVNDNFITDEDQELAGNILSNDSDPEGDSLSISTTPVSEVTNGNLTLFANGDFAYSPTPDFYGNDSFTYEVCDDGIPSLCMQGNVMIAVDGINDIPIAQHDSVSTLEDTPFFISILGNDFDVDGNLDLSGITLQNLPPASQGAVTVNTNGTLTFTPATDFNGLVNVFNYTVCDDGTPLPAQCISADVNVTVNSVNDAPTALNDFNTTNEDSTVLGNVLNNDSDLSDNDNLFVITSLIVEPVNGSTNINEDGSYTYIPNLNFNGVDQFEYQVCDDGIPVECSTAIVEIMVNSVNDVPVIVDDIVETTEDTPISIAILNNDNDIDGNLDPLSIVLNNQIPIVEGTISINTNGTVNFIPAENYFGIVTPISYTVCDSGIPLPIQCANGVINIMVTSVNDAPVAEGDSATCNEDNQAMGNVLSNDADLIDNDSLVASMTLIAEPINGIVTLMNNGDFVYTPSLDFYGNDSFIYEVCDDGIPAACDQAIVTVTVNSINDIPFAGNDFVFAQEDTPVNISILSNDSDKDGDLDLNSLSIINGAQLIEGTLMVNADGTITFSPIQDYNGTVTQVSYEICDQGIPVPVLCDTASIQIEVLPVNDIPTPQNDSIITVEDKEVTDNLLFNDSDLDGDSLTASTILVSGPQNGIATLSSDGTYSYTPNLSFSGTDSFQYEVCDDGIPSLCAEAVIYIIVFPCPEAVIIEPTSICALQLVTFETIDQGNGTTYEWDFGPTATPQQASGTKIEVSYSTAGSLFANLSVTKDGCTITNQVFISVSEEAFADAGVDDTICPGSSTVLGGMPTGPVGASYLWYPSTGLNSDFVANPVASPTMTTTYTLTTTLGNCSITDQVTVVVDNLSTPFADAGPDQVVCGTGTQIGGAPTGGLGSTYSWSPINGLDDPNSPNPFASPVVPTTYTVTVSKNGCSVTDEVSITKTTPPSMDAGDDQTLCYNTDGQGVTLGGPNNFPVNTYNWSPTFGLSHPIEGNTFANPAVTTVYTLTASRNGCSVTDQVTVTVNYCNDYPIAINDQMTSEMDSVLETNLLVNDFDPNGDNLELYLSPIINPENGNVIFYENGNIEYTPNLSFIGVDSLKYETCDDGIPTYCNQAMFYIEILPPPCTEVNLQVMLEGPFDPVTGKMKTTLNIGRGILPGQTPLNPVTVPTPAGQPFDMSPWNYTGSEGLDFSDLSYNPEVVDWVLVSFRTNPAKNTELARTAALLLEDGTVELVNPCPLADSITSDLYIVIEHRSHIGVMTPLPVPIVDRKIGYDFTVQDSYKTGGYGQKYLPVGKWVMFSGDANQASDIGGYDINGSDRILWNIENGSFDSYSSSDFNMDGDVNGSDKILHTENNGVFSEVPK